jgi:hypothetical protein
MSKVTVYEGNSAVLAWEVFNPDGSDAVLTSFTPTLTVKQNKDDTTALITKTGVISSNDITFTILDTENDLDKGTYYYEVTLESSTQKLTIAQDRFVVRESIVYIS